MKGVRLYTLTSSLHPWLYEAAKGNPDQQVKHALDRLLREIESDVEWYVSSNMEEQLRLLDKMTGLDSLTYLNTYEGGSLATTGVSKIRIAGKKVALWNTSTPNFPSVEHVRPISDCWRYLLQTNPALYTVRWSMLDEKARHDAQVALQRLGMIAPVCLITRAENRRLKKTKRGVDPWACYRMPKDGGPPLVVRKIRDHRLSMNVMPCTSLHKLL